MSNKPGVKNDTGKLRFDLIPVGPLRQLADVYTRGATKYADRNWEQGLLWGRVYAAMMRHATAWWGGETNDPEDGQHHLASVAWCALALMEFEKTHPELDDRPTSALSSSLPRSYTYILSNSTTEGNVENYKNDKTGKGRKGQVR